MPPRARPPAPALTEETAPPPAPVEQTATAEPDRGGWFRNSGLVDLVVLGDGATAVLAPGRIAHLQRTPTHRDLSPATESDFDAQQGADAARAEAEATPEPAPTGAADETATEA